MNDHQDSENFAYNRSWDEILEMLDKAERKQNWHYMQMKSSKDKTEKIEHHIRLQFGLLYHNKS